MVTYLAWSRVGASSPRPTVQPELQLVRQQPACGDYLALFRAVGEQWLWFSRLRMPPEELQAIIEHPDVEIYFLYSDHNPEQAIGILELDARIAGTMELAFIGLVPQMLGRGYGSWLLQQAQSIAVAREVDYLWLHTCTFDHPDAVAFYLSHGFEIYARALEVTVDPRLDGTLHQSCAPHVPLFSRVPPFVDSRARPHSQAARPTGPDDEK